ncbi:hypothetical protein Tco_1293800, partial [Tanacetum coccineum]
MDKSQITRKQSKIEQTRTRESEEYKAEARKVKPQSNPVKEKPVIEEPTGFTSIRRIHQEDQRSVVSIKKIRRIRALTSQDIHDEKRAIRQTLEELDKDDEVENRNEPVRSAEKNFTGEKVRKLVETPRLTEEKLIETDIRLSLASQSHIYPLGIADDVLVEIVGFIYPVDFVILDIKEDRKRPFILRTPFLTTAKAETSVLKGAPLRHQGGAKAWGVASTLRNGLWRWL